MLSEVERSLERLRAEQLARSLDGPIEAVTLELRHRYTHVAAKPFSLTEQHTIHPLCEELRREFLTGIDIANETRR